MVKKKKDKEEYSPTQAALDVTKVNVASMLGLKISHDVGAGIPASAAKEKIQRIGGSALGMASASGLPIALKGVMSPLKGLGSGYEKPKQKKLKRMVW